MHLKEFSKGGEGRKPGSSRASARLVIQLQTVPQLFEQTLTRGETFQLLLIKLSQNPC